MGGAEGALSAANAASRSSCRLVYLLTTSSSQLLQAHKQGGAVSGKLDQMCVVFVGGCHRAGGRAAQAGLA